MASQDKELNALAISSLIASATPPRDTTCSDSERTHIKASMVKRLYRTPNWLLARSGPTHSRWPLRRLVRILWNSLPISSIEYMGWYAERKSAALPSFFGRTNFAFFQLVGNLAQRRQILNNCLCLSTRAARVNIQTRPGTLSGPGIFLSF